MNNTYRISCKYLAIFEFFLPMVSIKALGMGSSDTIAVIITVICLALSLISLSRMRLSRREERFWGLLFLLGFILIYTTGKFFILLSIYSMFLLSKISSKKLRKVLMYICLIAVGILILLNWGKMSYQARFVNGEWTNITKRDNTILVTYFMFFNLFLMQKKVKIVHLLVLVLGGLLLFLFTFSRSGLICIVMECIFLFAFKFKRVQKSKIVRYVITFMPIILFVGCLLVNSLLGVIPMLDKLNMLLQLRLSQGKQFLSMYSLTLFGQHVTVSNMADSYMVLDNTYLNLYINYGIVLSVLWIILNVETIRYLYNKEDFRGIVIIISYLFYGITESFILVSFINAAFFYYSEYLAYKIARKPIEIVTINSPLIISGRKKGRKFLISLKKKTRQ